MIKTEPVATYMSTSLQGNIHSSELEPISNPDLQLGIVCVFSVEFNKVSESFVGLVSTFLLDEHYEVEMKLSSLDAFKFAKCWPNLIVSNLEFHYGTDVFNVIKDYEKYKISAIRLLDVDLQQNVGTIAMKLCSENKEGVL